MSDLILATRPYTQSQPASYNPYIEMAMRVMDSALKMETEAKSVATLLTATSGRPRTRAEEKKLQSLYSKIDRQEVRLKKCLNP